MPEPSWTALDKALQLYELIVHLSRHDWVQNTALALDKTERLREAKGLREAAAKVAEVNAEIPWKSEPTVVSRLNRLEAELLTRAVALEKGDG